jgi:hypothetical protein
MTRLKSRQKFVPNGFKFYQPETKWREPRNASFQVLVDALIAHRHAQPFLAKQNGWNLEFNAVADEVDEFNAKICEQMGWTDYIQSPAGSAPPPKFHAPSPSDQNKLAAAAGRVKKIWSGVRTLNDWIDSGEPAVTQEQSNARAAVCAACPQNGKGDFSHWFTQPAADVIKRQIEKLEDRKLKTDSDDKIQICEICLCPLRLKVHTPLKFINTYLDESVLRDLERVKDCWIPAERKN